MVTSSNSPIPHTQVANSMACSFFSRRKLCNPPYSNTLAYAEAASSATKASQRIGSTPTTPAKNHGVAQ
ncbi:hypothetical protein D3C77_640550 [compost metagenome]